MMKGTLVIEFEYEDEDYSIRQIEKDAGKWMDRYADDHSPMTITHIEANTGAT